VLILKFPLLLLLLPYFATFVPAHADLLAIDTETSEDSAFTAVAGVMRDRIGDFSVGVTGHGHAYDEAATWGGSFEGWVGDHTSPGSGDPHVFGLESSVIAQNPDSFSVKAPVFTTFKTRRDGIDQVLSPEQFLNAFNYNSSHIFADSQRRDANGVYSAAHSVLKASRWAVDRTVEEPYAAGLDWRRITRIGHPYDEEFYFSIWAKHDIELGMAWDDVKEALCFYRNIKVEDPQERQESFCIDMTTTAANTGTAELQQRLAVAEERITQLEETLEQLLNSK
jgi:hypothetical protein